MALSFKGGSKVVLNYFLFLNNKKPDKKIINANQLTSRVNQPFWRDMNYMV